MRFNGVAFRRPNCFVFGALFVLVVLIVDGCATGIVGDAGDGGDLSDAPLAAMDSGTDSQSVDSGKADTGSKADTSTADTGSACTDWAGPTVTSTCTDSCNATTHVCGPNGCYNMWWCNIPSGICSAKPPSGC